MNRHRYISLILIVATLVSVSLLSVTGYTATRVGFGVGTGVAFPELVSYNAKLFAEFPLPEVLGLSLGLRGSLELMSAFGTLIAPLDTSVFIQFDLAGPKAYLGAGAGFVLMQSSFGSQTTLTVNGLLGAKYPLFGENLFLIGQLKAKTFPGVEMLYELEIGFMQYMSLF